MQVFDKPLSVGEVTRLYGKESIISAARRGLCSRWTSLPTRRS
ncbi:hypothetical protein ACR6C2_16220 [Streptomyces sp. INA 01156]